MLAFGGSTEATHYTDVSGWVELSQESLRRHKLYLDNLGAGLGSGDDPTAFLVSAAEETGRAVGVHHAVSFEVVET